jgi:hypothetical protein
MATKIVMWNEARDLRGDGFYGFSWTTLFFGFFPALFRGDFLVFVAGLVVDLLVGVFTSGVGVLAVHLVWAFLYNRQYTRRLLERGYVPLIADRALELRAQRALGIAGR